MKYIHYDESIKIEDCTLQIKFVCITGDSVEIIPTYVDDYGVTIYPEQTFFIPMGGVFEIKNVNLELKLHD